MLPVIYGRIEIPKVPRPKRERVNNIELKLPEIEIIKLIAQGAQIKQIAIETKYSENTIEGYIMKIRKNFGAKNSPHLIAIAYQKGILK